MLSETVVLTLGEQERWENRKGQKKEHAINCDISPIALSYVSESTL